MTIPTRPILRWHGGKWILAPWIISHFPPHRIYTECYGGAGSVLMRKPRAYAEVYNDLDGEVVNLFKVARENGDQLKQVLSLTPFSREEFILSYEPAEECIEQARRTVVRSFMGFGSNAHNQKTGFRANSNKSGTTPAIDWKNYPTALEAITERLRGIVIENRDAIEVMVHHDTPQTLHYVDPPYVLSTRDKGKDYRFEMTDEQHCELAKALNSLSGMVVLSAYDSELYRTIYKGWKCVKKDALADGAKPRKECLFLNPAAVNNTLQQSLF